MNVKRSFVWKPRWNPNSNICTAIQPYKNKKLKSSYTCPLLTYKVLNVLFYTHKKKICFHTNCHKCRFRVLFEYHFSTYMLINTLLLLHYWIENIIRCWVIYFSGCIFCPNGYTKYTFQLCTFDVVQNSIHIGALFKFVWYFFFTKCCFQFVKNFLNVHWSAEIGTYLLWVCIMMFSFGKLFGRYECLCEYILYTVKYE